MIAKALFEYLTTPGPVTAGVIPFVEPQIVSSDIVCVDRNDARRHLQNRVGSSSYYYDRRPQGTGHTAITFRRITGERDYHLQGEVPFPKTYFDVGIWGRDPDGAARNEITAALLRLAIGGFRGYWGSRPPVYISSCTLIRDSDRATRPVDGSDYWTHLRTFDAMIHHYEPVPDFATVEPEARFETVISGVSMRLRDTSPVVAGDPVVDIHWVVSEVDGGPAVHDFGGHPDTSSTGGGVVGLHRDQTVDITGLDSLFITQTVTLKSGRTSTKTQSIGV